jgi:hypothetical protein
MADSGQITVTTAGTAVQGPDTGGLEVIVKAMAGNTGIVYIGNDGAGDVTALNGFELTAKEEVLVRKNLAAFWFDAATSGDKLCWVKVQ